MKLARQLQTTIENLFILELLPINSISFCATTLSDELAQVRAEKKEFLAKIGRIIPWGE